MAYIPTISQLQTQIENNLRTQLSITRTWVGKVALRCMAIVFAGMFKLCYIFMAFVEKNIFPDTADSETVGGTLERFGRVKLNRDPYPAIAGVYTITLTGTAPVTIPTGTKFKSAINATSPDQLFQTEINYTISSFPATINISAQSPGTIAQLAIGDTMNLTSPLANVNSLATVSVIVTPALDSETLEEYRNKILQAFRLEPQGGAATDYRLWSLDVPAVRTSYPYTKYGVPYAVQLFVEALPDDSQVGQPAGVPTATTLTDVQAVVELDPDTTKPLSTRGRRPVGVFEVDYLAVVPLPVIVTITGLTDTSTPVQSAITTALNDLLYSVRPYIAGADGTNKNDILSIASVISCIFSVLTSGNSFTSITLNVNGNPVTSFTFGDIPSTYGNYPYLSNVIYV